MLKVRFAGGIVDSGCTLCQHGSTQDICSDCYRRFIEEDVAAFQARGVNVKKVIGRVETEFGAQLLKSQKVCIQSSASDLITARPGDIGPTESCEDRPQQYYRASQ